MYQKENYCIWAHYQEALYRLGTSVNIENEEAAAYDMVISGKAEGLTVIITSYTEPTSCS